MAGPKQKKPVNSSSKPNSEPRVPVTNDSRFVTIHNDPRFALPKKKDTKFAVDKRFQRMLKDDDFAQKASVDRYGRKLRKDAGKEELKRYYRMDEEDDELKEKNGPGAEEEEVEVEEVGGAKFDPARGEGLISSSEEESSDEEEVDEEEEESAKALEAAATVLVGDVTNRFAVVNLDWDNVRAVDLMKTFSSFESSGGKVLRVSIYPSEFGKERMEREELEGPPSEIFKPRGKTKVVEEYESGDEEITEKSIIKEDKGEEFDSAKLRNYQLERLRYFYAVVECDKPTTAKNIYDQCDGAEYETTANFFDLRFIPDGTAFDDDKPRDTCTEAPENYKPNEFVTDALQHSKVKLTWDEDDQLRKQASKRAFSQRDIEDMDLKAYLASSDSESESSDKETSKEKYRALLSGLPLGKRDKSPTGEMEVTFTSGLSAPKDSKVIQDDPNETTIQAYARKERERRQRRKEKAKLLREGGKPASDHEEEKEQAETGKEEADLGFNDPFFDETPVSASQTKKEKKKAEKAQKAAEAAAQAAKRAELEVIMADGDEGLREDGSKLEHFDMKQVVKAEKGKKSKKKRRGAEPEGLQEGFELDVKDPRFAAVYEKHQFAIDPTNPRFVKTEGMKKMMEERRKRTQRRSGEGEAEEEVGGKKKKAKVGEGEKGDDIKRLVQSLKRKAKK
ncbi:pre-rRNA-processing protein esf1 [Rhizina undulata]